MANDINQCTFIGRLAADPELRYMQNGDAVANFRIAVGWKTKDKEGAEWVSITAFGKLSEIVGEYCKKGGQVFVQGRLKTDEYTDKEGQKRYSTKIIADRLQLLGGKPSGSAEQRQEAPRQAGKPSFDDLDQDIPF